MPRKSVPLCPNDPYHISARCINREWFQLPLGTVWCLMEDYLYLVSSVYQLRLHAFVLMSNHFHLLVSAPEGNLSQAMLYFMRETSREITRLSGRINQTYGARHHKTRIRYEHYFLSSYKYVYRNPVRAGICERVEEYRYSTLSGLLGLSHLTIPIVEDRILFDPNFKDSSLHWLNTPPRPDTEEEVRLALRRAEMDFKSPRQTGRVSALATNIL